MTENTQNSLSDSELKERMNFAKMFARQEKQIKQTAHIKNLLTPSTKEIEEAKPQNHLTNRIQELEDKYNNDSIQQNIELRISELELSLVKTFTQSLEKLELKRKINFNFDFSNKKNVQLVCASMLVSTLFIGIGLASGSKTEIKEKIVYKEKPVVAKVVPQYVMTKFVNIRTKAATSSNKITTLAPNSIVEVLEVHQGWHKIKYKNHLSGKTLIGWAYGENLKKIQ